WSNAQISEHYGTCIRLSTENKITTKNAFGLHLIDYMTEILNQKNSELTNFKVAVGTLDASAKIYSVRVDTVHADTYKVLGGLGKDSAPAKDLDSPEEEDSSAPQAIKKVQPKKKQSFKTIEQNLNNINVSEASRRCEVDPMFQKAAASFDECSTAGIFLTGLRSQNFHSELLFESKFVPLPSSETLPLPNLEPVKVMDLKSLLAQCVEKRLIYSSLAGFQFTKWDEESHEESVSALLDKFRQSEQVFDPDAEPDSDGEDGAVPLPHDDFHSDSPRSTAMEKLGEFTDSVNSFRTISQSQSKGPFREGDIGTMCLHLSMNPGEYSYFSPRTLSMWAGPEHWRFRPRHRSDADSEKEPKRKNAKKVFELNFDEDIDFETYFHQTKASVTLAKSILESQNVRSTTLPADFNYDPQNILQLFLKPLIKLSRMSQPVTALDNEAEIGDYDYNNPNDTSNFCPALQVGDSDDDDDPRELLAGTRELNPEGPELNGTLAGPGGSAGGELKLLVDQELDLIAEPLKINRIAVQYARTAKKMDMRRLKENMWELLSTGQCGGPGEQQGGDGDKEKNVSVLAGEKILSDITKDLLHRLPAAMATNLSVPLAFVCLLHLANEKNLKLEGTEDLSDVLVTQGN
ncbi:CND2 protein, partial [Formicarius rufipectus]|nr:CND2 protein [Formicarius rufipectus]